jgi:general stress protein CsbA
MELVPSPLIDTLEALETVTAKRSRREKLLRIVAGKVSRGAYVCTAIIAICSVAALLNGDRRAATIIGIQACWVIGFVFISNKAARRKALRELQEMKQST